MPKRSSADVVGSGSSRGGPVAKKAKQQQLSSEDAALVKACVVRAVYLYEGLLYGDDRERAASVMEQVIDYTVKEGDGMPEEVANSLMWDTPVRAVALGEEAFAKKMEGIFGETIQQGGSEALQRLVDAIRRNMDAIDYNLWEVEESDDYDY